MSKQKLSKRKKNSSPLSFILIGIGAFSLWFYTCSGSSNTLEFISSQAMAMGTEAEATENQEYSLERPSLATSPIIQERSNDTGNEDSSFANSSSSQGDIIRGDSTLMELPQLAGSNACYFVTHRAGGLVNYSVEYDILKRHPRWVAFSFDDATAADNVGRSDHWRWDPDIPASYSTEDMFKHSGYSRGHMVASEDRTFSQEANEQTFYYSNVSPQLQEHNAGIWLKLEKKVRQWGRNSNFRDVLYVAKGGTIREDQTFGERVRGKIVIPKYYWMALLLRKDGQYHSIAFLTEHRHYERGESNIKNLALSIDELERITGLDFFYHLPKAIAQQVEAEDPHSKVANKVWWR